jgi:hypothetical protein
MEVIIVFFIQFVCCLLHAAFFLEFLFSPEDGIGVFLRKVSRLLTDYMALYPRRCLLVYVCIFLAYSNTSSPTDCQTLVPAQRNFDFIRILYNHLHMHLLVLDQIKLMTTLAHNQQCGKPSVPPSLQVLLETPDVRIRLTSMFRTMTNSLFH